jgi:hypothetical protein
MQAVIHFIGKSDKLRKELQSAVAPDLSVVQHASAKAAAASLTEAGLDDQLGLVVLLETRDLDLAVAECCSLREMLNSYPLTIIALIQAPEFRDRCIEAGADDCLILGSRVSF